MSRRASGLRASASISTYFLMPTIEDPRCPEILEVSFLDRQSLKPKALLEFVSLLWIRLPAKLCCRSSAQMASFAWLDLPIFNYVLHFSFNLPQLESSLSMRTCHPSFRCGLSKPPETNGIRGEPLSVRTLPPFIIRVSSLRC